MTEAPNSTAAAAALALAGRSSGSLAFDGVTERLRLVLIHGSQQVGRPNGRSTGR
jgi:hypothetical protein